MERLKIIVGFGLLGALVVAGSILFYNRGAKPTIEGRITQVRTLAMDQENSVAIVNFLAENTSDRVLIINRRELEVIDGNDNRHVGMTISAPDIAELFKYFKALGGMGDAPLVPRLEVAPGDEIRGLMAARFPVPKHELDARKTIKIKVSNIRGRTSEIELVSER